MRVSKFLNLFVLFTLSALADNTIVVHNKTFRDLYLGIYYRFPKIPFFDQKPAQLATDIRSIDAQSSLSLDRPERWYGADRQLVFVEDKSLLKDDLCPQELDALNPLFVGNMQGGSFYIVTNSKGDHQGYTAMQWNALKEPVAQLQQDILNILPAVADNSYKDQVAYIRTGNQLCDQENSYLQNRKQFIKAALENNNMPSSYIPNVSILCSGGGFRAMLYSVGALKVLNKTGILDLSSYLVGLSGSTWAIATWISSDLSLDAFHDWLMNNIGYQLNNLDKEDFTLMGEVLLTKYCVGQPIGFVDMYGSFIANDLFDSFTDDKIMVHLSEQSSKIVSGQIPMPLYTSISGQSDDPKAEYLWYEFSPYEVGAHWLKAYVPTWAFGRKFKNGISTTNAPEQPMGTLLGTFGLAIGITVDRMFSEADINENTSSLLLKKIIKTILNHYGDDRPISAEYFNFAYGMSDRLFSEAPIINLVDGGINCNIPYAPVSGVRPERKADMLIIIDASAGQVGGELHKVEGFARWHKLPFPTIDYSQITSRAVSVFKDDANPDAPIVIYIPRVVDEAALAEYQSEFPELYAQLHNFDMDSCINHGACNTFNFFYTPDEARRMMALGEFNALISKEIILENISSIL